MKDSRFESTETTKDCGIHWNLRKIRRRDLVFSCEVDLFVVCGGSIFSVRLYSTRETHGGGPSMAEAEVEQKHCRTVIYAHTVYS